MNAIRTVGEGTSHARLETPRGGDNVTPRNLDRTGLASKTRTITPTNNQGKEGAT